jgi:hypothetical protein
MTKISTNTLTMLVQVNQAGWMDRVHLLEWAVSTGVQNESSFTREFARGSQAGSEFELGYRFRIVILRAACFHFGPGQIRRKSASLWRSKTVEDYACETTSCSEVLKGAF